MESARANLSARDKGAVCAILAVRRGTRAYLPICRLTKKHLAAEDAELLNDVEYVRRVGASRILSIFQ